ncbi:MAG: hypothetical protein HY784_04045 [Chloroflexi bacterium]|nr:hypothetical protein [Chloroflexota bacterium]
MSPTGRFVAFFSAADNLVSHDTNHTGDVFVHDRKSGQTLRASVGYDGQQGNGASDSAAISANGRFVAFRSAANNLVSDDTNRVNDIFVRGLLAGTAVRVSVASDGSQGNGTSGSTSISASGRIIAFNSDADNLIPDDTNRTTDAFVRDILTGATTRISVASDGAPGNGVSNSPVISASGRYVAFRSSASNLVAGDSNGLPDIFVHDRETGETTRVSVASDGTQGNGIADLPVISASGRYVAFRSEASNLVPGDTNRWSDIFVHDRETGETTRVSIASDGAQGDGPCGRPAITAIGIYVAFASAATNLVSGDTNASYDVFVHNRETGETTRVSVASDGTQGNADSEEPALSAWGQYVAFESFASHLVNGDTNGSQDVFVRER